MPEPLDLDALQAVYDSTPPCGTAEEIEAFYHKRVATILDAVPGLIARVRELEGNQGRVSCCR